LEGVERRAASSVEGDDLAINHRVIGNATESFSNDGVSGAEVLIIAGPYADTTAALNAISR
jgi:hypothetical protein